MITRAVTIEDIDDLYLTWNSHINGSALYRRALRDEMELRDVDPDELRDLFEWAREQGYTKDESPGRSKDTLSPRMVIHGCVASGGSTPLGTQTRTRSSGRVEQAVRQSNPTRSPCTFTRIHRESVRVPSQFVTGPRSSIRGGRPILPC